MTIRGGFGVIAEYVKRGKPHFQWHSRYVEEMVASAMLAVRADEQNCAILVEMTHKEWQNHECSFACTCVAAIKTKTSFQPKTIG